MACGEIISEEGSNNKVLLTLEENGKMIIKYNYLSISDNPSLHCETIEKFGPQINKLTFGYVAEQHQDSGYASIDKLLQCFINLTQLTLAPTSFVQFDKTLKHKHPSSTSEDLSFINCTMHKKDTFPYLSTKYLLIDSLFLHNCDFKDKEEEGRAAAADYTSLHINMQLTSITTLKVAHPYFRNLDNDQSAIITSVVVKLNAGGSIAKQQYQMQLSERPKKIQNPMDFFNFFSRALAPSTTDSI